MKHPWLKCTKCGVKDVSTKAHVGTKVVMHCIDCAGPGGKATLCRNCCPTEHGTTDRKIDQNSYVMQKDDPTAQRFVTKD